MAKILISQSKYLKGAKTALQKVHVKWFLIILTENVATVKSTVW